jgi:hypothetical protein
MVLWNLTLTKISSENATSAWIASEKDISRAAFILVWGGPSRSWVKRNWNCGSPVKRRKKLVWSPISLIQFRESVTTIKARGPSLDLYGLERRGLAKKALGLLLCQT